MLVALYKIGGVHFLLLGTNGFHVKAENERSTAASSRWRQNLKYSPEKISRRLWQTTSTHCTKKRAARLFFFIQPIKSMALICGVVVDES